VRSLYRSRTCSSFSHSPLAFLPRSAEAETPADFAVENGWLVLGSDDDSALLAVPRDRDRFGQPT
jgi:hypothetical protein